MMLRLLSRFSLRRRNRSRSSLSQRPYLEALEDRSLLSFYPAGTYAVGVAPKEIVAGDFNADGNLDLATANAGLTQSAIPGNVSVLLGKGDGTFQNPVAYGQGPYT